MPAHAQVFQTATHGDMSGYGRNVTALPHLGSAFGADLSQKKP